MQDHKITRRQFLQNTAVTTTGLVLACPKNTFGQVPSLIKIEEPFHGAILNYRQGKQTDKGLKIEVSGEAPLGDKVAVNGIPTKRTGTKFTAEILLRKQENEIVAVSQGSFGQHEHRIRVIWDRYSYQRYRFAIDDNSFFLRDIFQNNYKSLFDCFYLKMLQDLNRKYGATVVLNIYYTTGDDFNLTQFPDKYKGEWRDNSNWLKLAFHAYANDPDKPYYNAPAKKLLADLDLVAEQIHRFAGKETYTLPTVIHWAIARPESLKALAKRGVQVLTGGFVYRKGSWGGHYFLDDARCEYITQNDVLMDFDTGIAFSIADFIGNKTPVKKVVPKFNALVKNPNRDEIMDLFTHEQYFWKFYNWYIPDHAERIEAAIRWVTEHGYKPVFFHEGLLAKPQ